MSKKRTLISLLLVLMLVFSACTQSKTTTADEKPAEETTQSSAETETKAPESNATEKTKIVYWTPFSGGDADNMKEIVDSFNASQSEVEVELFNIKSEEYYTKLMTAIPADQGPDIAISHATSIMSLYEDGLLVPVDNYIADSGINFTEYNPTITDYTIIDEEHYAVPLDIHPIVYYVNNDFYPEADFIEGDKATIPSGKDEYLKFLEETQKNLPADGVTVSATSSSSMAYYIWSSLFFQANGEFFNEDGTAVNFNNEKGLKAAELMQEMIKKNYWPKGIQNGGELFVGKKAATAINGVWASQTFSSTEGLNSSASLFPQVFETKTAWADAHTFVIPSNRKLDENKAKASMIFANYVVENGDIWAKSGKISVKASVMEKDSYKEMPYYETFKEAADHVTFYPKHPQMNAVLAELKINLESLINETVTPQEFLDNAEKACNAILAE